MFSPAWIRDQQKRHAVLGGTLVQRAARNQQHVALFNQDGLAAGAAGGEPFARCPLRSG